MSETRSGSGTTLALAGVFLSAALLMGCPPKKVVKKTAGGDLSADSNGGLDANAGDMYDPSVDTRELDIRGPDGAAGFTKIEELDTVRFDYDAFALTPEAITTLKGNANYLTAHKDLQVLVEGHADDRGTLEYNIALGQKRARTVREYYIRLGVPGRSIGTISFGEENLLCSGQEDTCWSRNRRAETKIRAQVTSNGIHKRTTP